MLPLKRMSEPEDLVGLLQLLVGPDSDYITGALIPAYGGWLA